MQTKNDKKKLHINQGLRIVLSFFGAWFQIDTRNYRQLKKSPSAIFASFAQQRGQSKIIKFTDLALSFQDFLSAL